MKATTTTTTILITLASLVLGSISCKKEEDIPTASNTGSSEPTVTTNIFLIGDTVDFSTTTSCIDFSVGMDLDSIHTDPLTRPAYSLSSEDSACSFGTTNNKQLVYRANDNSLLFLDPNFGGNTKKFLHGESIDYNNENYVSGSLGKILEKGNTTTFQLNETAYLGAVFPKNGTYYNGWIKIKTLNNYYSCIIISYGVSQTPISPVKAGK